MRHPGQSRPILKAIGEASALLPAGLDAAPAAPEMGATARATIAIRVSVAPRVGVVGAGGRRTNRFESRAPCLWSTLPSRTFTVTLQPLAQDRTSPGEQELMQPRRTLAGTGSIPTDFGGPIEILAERSAEACAAGGSARLLRRLGDIDQQDSLLLILAPQ